MRKRICPICDHEMKTRHYCRFCRSFVRRPDVADVNYYLNERHPANERNCGYHTLSPVPPAAPSSGKDERGAQPSLGSAGMGSVQTSLGRAGMRNPQLMPKPARPAPGRPGAQPPQTGSSGMGAVSSVFVIISIVVLLLIALGGMLPFLIFLF